MGPDIADRTRKNKHASRDLSAYGNQILGPLSGLLRLFSSTSLPKICRRAMMSSSPSQRPSRAVSTPAGSFRPTLRAAKEQDIPQGDSEPMECLSRAAAGRYEREALRGWRGSPPGSAICSSGYSGRRW